MAKRIFTIIYVHTMWLTLRPKTQAIRMAHLKASRQSVTTSESFASFRATLKAARNGVQETCK